MRSRVDMVILRIFSLATMAVATLLGCAATTAFLSLSRMCFELVSIRLVAVGSLSRPVCSEHQRHEYGRVILLYSGERRKISLTSSSEITSLQGRSVGSIVALPPLFLWRCITTATIKRSEPRRYLYEALRCQPMWNQIKAVPNVVGINMRQQSLSNQRWRTSDYQPIRGGITILARLLHKHKTLPFHGGYRLTTLLLSKASSSSGRSCNSSLAFLKLIHFRSLLCCSGQLSFSSLTLTS